MKPKARRAPKQKIAAPRQMDRKRSKALHVVRVAPKHAKVEGKSPPASLELPTVVERETEAAIQPQTTLHLPVIWSPLALLATQQFVATNLTLGLMRATWGRAFKFS